MRGDGLGTFDLDLVSDPVAALKVGRDFGHNRSHLHIGPGALGLSNPVADPPTAGERMDRPGFIERHPIVTSLPPETTLLAMLDAEDAAMFPA